MPDVSTQNLALVYRMLQQPHRVAVGGLSQRRLQQLEQATNAPPGTVAAAAANGHAARSQLHSGPVLMSAPQSAPVTASAGVLAQGHLGAANPLQYHAPMHHRLHAVHQPQVRPSGTNSWVGLLLASCCITSVILVVLFAFGVIDIDTSGPIQLMNRVSSWVCSSFALGRVNVDQTTDVASRPQSTLAAAATATCSNIPVVAATGSDVRSIRSAGALDGTQPVAVSSEPTSTWSTLSNTMAAAAAAVAVAGSTATTADLQPHSAITGTAEAPPTAAATSAYTRAQRPLTAASADAALPSPSRPLGSKGEGAALAALHRIFGTQVVFTKVRPTWLRNPESGGRCLELDLFSEELKLGVECDGVQHYVWVNSFHKTRAQFDAQVRRDRLKDALCKVMGVTLVRIPFTVPLNQYETFIRQQLQESGFQHSSTI